MAGRTRSVDCYGKSEAKRVIRLYIILSLIFIGGCAGATSFLINTGSNLFSDQVDRQVQKKVNPSDCKE